MEDYFELLKEINYEGHSFDHFFTPRRADFLYDLIIRYGVAEIVMSDQGREFMNKVNQEL